MNYTEQRCSHCGLITSYDEGHPSCPICQTWMDIEIITEQGVVLYHD